MGQSANLYETDFHAWTKEQAALLREVAALRRNAPLDWDHLAEEIEDLGGRERAAVESHLETVIEHLLKLEYSAATQPRAGWRVAVLKSRVALRRKLTGTLINHLRATLAALYRDGRKFAVLGLEEYAETADPPAECPYSWEVLLDEDWWPVNRHGLG